MAVHCSFHQYAHLKVLMDEIFKNRYKCTFHIKVRHPDRVLTGDKEFNDVIEYILFYSKNINYKFPSKIEEKIDDEYVYMVETKDCDEILEIEGKKVEVYKPNNYILRKKEPHSDNFKTISVRGSIREKNSSGRYYVKNLEKLIGKYPPLTLFKVPNMGDDKYDFRYFHLPKDGNKNGTYLQGKPTSSDVTYKPYSNFYDYEKDYNIVSDEGGVEFRNGKKPESLIKFLIELFTNENDIVLDYHLGSATTASVSHKLNRQYIGMEQMNYFNDITVQRILNTINGENEGLSKYIEWKGGGEFISMELCNNNQSYIDTITDCTSSSQLIEIKNELKNSNFIRYEVKDENLFDDKNQFDTLPMDEQKEILIKILDKNHLYVNYSEMDDKQFDISDEVKKFNREFYEVK
jgi:adenine-specific DNA-methyltransferase